MPWGAFSASLVITFLLQVTLVGRYQALSAVDLFLVLAVVYGLAAPAEDARLGAWIIGFVQDLGADGALGVHAFSLGIVAIVLTNLRELVQLDRWWARLLVASFGAFPGVVVMLLHRELWAGAGATSFVGILTLAAWLSVVAALLAAVLTGLPWLVRLRRRKRYLSLSS